MHWIIWVIILALVFLATYNPRTGNLTKFFALETSVEDGSSRKAQSDRDTNESN